ncbi:exonuclease domain-containing protein [Aminobacterium colombiense]|uniref:exonuclease domain-containing protein n=1 Tax=Aminobacterium colombiense TaxID=81468 RepID=UPI00257C7740|nr:exonuclease domain-containing protein [Aminobacterium sp. UBA4987]
MDFETANEKRCSPCALGIAIVENGEITETKSWLIKPPKDYYYFNPFNVRIHGIQKRNVKNKPEFNQIWEEVKPLLTNATVVAHNASFDISVIRNTLPLYSLDIPDCDIVCSVAVSKGAWPFLSSFSLPVVAGHLGLPLIHHDAEEDAKCSAEIILAACREHNVNDLKKLKKELRFRIGGICNGEYTPSGIHFPARAKPRHPSPEECGKDPFHPFYEKKITFTGTLVSMTREEAFCLVEKAGGTPQQGVTMQTNYLVMGIQDYSLFTDGERSAKTKKAEDLRAKGFPIEIMSEADFLKII